MRTSNLCLSLLAALSLWLHGCWPGRCDGAFRNLWPLAGANLGDSVEVSAKERFYIVADSRKGRSRDQLLTEAGVNPSSFFLDGPSGRVPAALSADLAPHAHSCASAATFELRPLSPLAPGEYTLVLLLDTAKWPAILGGDIRTWQGHRAITRQYRVRPPQRGILPSPNGDRDGDGVTNTADECPDAPGPAALPGQSGGGCPHYLHRRSPRPPGRVEIGAVVRFADGSATIVAGEIPALRKIAALLLGSEIRIAVVGRARRATAEAAYLLSQKRAVAVRDWLMGEGVSPERVDARASWSASSEDHVEFQLLERHEVDLTVTSCFPVGFGLSCSCEMRSRDGILNGRGKLTSCVGAELTKRLGAAPFAGISAPPLLLSIYVETESDSQHLCGAVIMESGERLRVVDFER